jgi:hypothetical protein
MSSEAGITAALGIEKGAGEAAGHGGRQAAILD